MDKDNPTPNNRNIDSVIERRAYQAEVLFHLSQQIAAIESVDELYSFLVEVLSEMFSAPQVVMLNYHAGKLYHKVSKGIDKSLSGAILGLDERVVLKIKDHGNIILVSEIQDQSFIDFIKEAQATFNFAPVALVNIMAQDNIEQIILIGQSLTFRVLERDDVKALMSFVNNVKAALKNLNLIRNIEEEKSKLDAIIDNSINGIVYVDTELNVLVINNMAREMFGDIKQGDNILKTLQGFESNMRIEELLIRPEDVMFELHEETKGAFYSVFSRKISDHSGQIIGMIILIRDVSEERHTENLKTVFMATISHKLRTPLTIIKEGVSLLEEGILGELNPKQRSVVSKTFVQTQYLTSLISSLLNFTKVHADLMSGGLHKQRNDVKQFFADLLLAMRDYLGNKQARVSLNIAEDVSSVYFDKDMLQKAVGNIIDNAVKFNPPGIAITIDVISKADIVEISISDNGAGIPQELVKHLFTSFSQVDTDMTGQVKGMGLGLYTAKEIIDAHKGKIECVGCPDKGTQFVIKLPII